MPPPRISSSASLRSRRRSTKMSTRSPIASGSRITSILRRRNYGSPNRRGLESVCCLLSIKSLYNYSPLLSCPFCGLLTSTVWFLVKDDIAIAGMICVEAEDRLGLVFVSHGHDDAVGKAHCLRLCCEAA